MEAGEGSAASVKWGLRSAACALWERKGNGAVGGVSNKKVDESEVCLDEERNELWLTIGAQNPCDRCPGTRAISGCN